MFDRFETDDNPNSETSSAWLGKGFPKLSPRLVAAAIFTTLTLVLLIYVLDLFPSRGCKTVEQCAANADQMASAGKFEPALKSLHTALELAGGQPDPAYAFIWCRRGDILLLTGDTNAAVEGYRTCLEWSSNNAAYEQVHSYAQERIEQLE